jgi:hypothetical protein
VMFYSSHATCIHTLRPPTLHHYKDGTRTIINSPCKLCRSMVTLMTHPTARHPPSLLNTLQQQSRHCMMTQSQPTNVNSSTPLHPFIQLTATSTCSSHHPPTFPRMSSSATFYANTTSPTVTWPFAQPTPRPRPRRMKVVAEEVSAAVATAAAATAEVAATVAAVLGGQQ